MGAKKSDLIMLQLYLRTPQIEYLERVAEREGEPVMFRVRAIINEAMARDAAAIHLFADATQKIRKSARLTRAQLTYIDRLVRKHGLQRSDIVRRLIDGAQAREEAKQRAGQKFQ